MSTMDSASAGDGHNTAPPRAMIKPIVILLVIVAAVLGGIFAWQTFIGGMMKKGMAAAATAPQTVSTIVAKTAS